MQAVHKVSGSHRLFFLSFPSFIRHLLLQDFHARLITKYAELLPVFNVNCITSRLVETGKKNSPLGMLMTVPFNKAVRLSQHWNSSENKNIAELVAFLSHAG